MDNMQRYIYPGSLLEGESLGNFTYRPITVPTKDIQLSVSFPAKKVTGVLANLSLSSTRQFIADIMSQEITGQQPASIMLDVQQFVSYDELKSVFGSNTNTSYLFWGTSSSSQEMKQKITKNTGLYVKFVQKYFTLDMDVPHDGFVLDKIDEKYSPVYVSSIAYGRLGVLSMETDEDAEEAEKIVKSAFSGLLTNTDKKLTTEQASFFQNAIMKVYTVGGSGESGVQTISGPEEFVSWVTTGSTFSASNPGVPIYASFSYLTDNSPYKIQFQVDIDSDPVYARMEYRNKREEKPATQVTDTYSDVYLAFYTDPSCQIRTVAPRYIKFQYSEHYNYYYWHWRVNYKDKKDEPNVTTFTRHNTARGVEIPILHNKHITHKFFYHGSKKFTYERKYYRYRLNEGNFYKILTPLNEDKVECPWGDS